MSWIDDAAREIQDHYGADSGHLGEIIERHHEAGLVGATEVDPLRWLDEAQAEIASLRKKVAGWKALCEKYMDLAGARGEKIALVEPRGKCGYRYHAADCDCGGVGGDS